MFLGFADGTCAARKIAKIEAVMLIGGGRAIADLMDFMIAVVLRVLVHVIGSHFIPLIIELNFRKVCVFPAIRNHILQIMY